MMMTIETDPGWPTTMPWTVRHSQVVTSHDIEHSLHESIICHKTVQISNSHRCGYVGKTIDAGHGMRQENWQVLRRQAKSQFFVPLEQSDDLEAYSDVDWGGDRATRRSFSVGVIIMRKSHCLEVLTKK